MQMFIFLLMLGLTIGSSLAAQTIPKQEPPSPILKAVVDAYGESLNRDRDLSKRFLDLLQKQADLRKSFGADKKQSDLTPSQLDECNLIGAQLRYLKLTMYNEVIKRRKFLQLLNLVNAYRIQDKAFEATLLGNANPSALDAQNLADAEIRKYFGEPSGSFWIKALNEVDTAEQVFDAQNIPLKGLTSEIEVSNQIMSSISDPLEFIKKDDFPKTPAGEVFMKRLDVEIKNNDPDAKEVNSYFVDQKERSRETLTKENLPEAHN